MSEDPWTHLKTKRLPNIAKDCQILPKMLGIIEDHQGFLKTAKDCWRLLMVNKHFPRLLKYHQRLPKIGKDCLKSINTIKITKDDQRWPMIPKYCLRSPKIAKYSAKLPKIVKDNQRSPNLTKDHQRWLKISKGCSRLPKISKDY